MIRYIDLGDQICEIHEEGEHDFAWFDTIIDRFLSYNGTHVWSTWEEFAKDHGSGNEDDYPLERLEGLFPKDRKEDEEKSKDDNLQFMIEVEDFAEEAVKRLEEEIVEPMVKERLDALMGAAEPGLINAYLKKISDRIREEGG